jgi:hypothetical protein
MNCYNIAVSNVVSPKLKLEKTHEIRRYDNIIYPNVNLHY